MRQILWVILFFVVSVKLSGQELGNLEGVRCFEFSGGVVLYGIDREGEKAIFTITHFDKNLEVACKYTRAFDTEPIAVYCTTYGDRLNCYIPSKPYPYAIGLDANLKETYFFRVDKELDKEHKDQLKEFKPVALNYSGSIESGFGMDERGINHIRYIKSDRLDFDLKKQCILRYTVIPQIKWAPWYSILWETPIEGFDKVKSTGIVYADETDVVNCLITRGKNKFWDDCIVRLDAKTGAIKTKIITTFPDKNEIFLLSNAYFDSQTEKIIAVGQLYRNKIIVDFHATCILVYDKKGSLVASKVSEFPELKLEDRSSAKLNEQSIVVKSIGKLGAGKYFAVLENKCNRKHTNEDGMSVADFSYYPIAFSYFEFDEYCNTSNEKMQYIDDLKAEVRCVQPKAGQKFIVFSETFHQNRKIQVVDFDADPGHLLNQFDAFDFDRRLGMSAGTYEQVPWSDVFVVSNSSAILFNKKRQSFDYELKLMKIK